MAQGQERRPASIVAEDEGLEAEARAAYGEAFDAFGRALAAAVREGRDAEEKDVAEAAFARAEVYVLKLDFLAEKTARFADLEKVLVAAIAPPGEVPPPLVARATFARMNGALARDDIGGARARARELGFLRRFAIAGPFDNERGGGFGERYGPEEKLDLGARYPGKAREVAWAIPPEDAFLGVVDLDAMMRPNDEALAYALIYIHGDAPVPQPAALRVGSDEGLKAWWNDGLAIERDAYRGRELDQDVVPIVVRPGWNRLLLKVAERRGPWGFAARVTAPDGGAVAISEAPAELFGPGRLAYEPEAAGSPGAGKADHRVARGAIDHYERLAAAGTATARDLFHLGYIRYRTHADDEDEHADREAWKRAVELEPASAIYRAYLALVSGQTGGENTVSREENARRLELERVLAEAPGHARVALFLAEHALRSLRNLERAESFVERALAANPTAVDALLLRGELLERRGFDALSRAYHRDLARRDDVPRTPDLLLRLAGHVRASGDPAGAEKLLVAALERDATHPAARRALIDLRRSRGDLDGAIAALDGWLRIAPTAVGARLERARILEAAGRFVEAEREVQRGLEIAPDDDAAVAYLGRLALRLEAPERALGLFGRALALNPKGVDVEKYVSFLKEEERPFEDDLKLDVEAVIAGAASIAMDPEVAARHLLRLVATKVNQDGTSSEFTQTAIRIENDEGIDDYDTYGVVYAVGEQKVQFRRATVVRRDGRREEARVDSHERERGGGEFTTYSRRTIDLPRLEVGDIVVLEHRVDDLTQSFFGDYFGKTFRFQDLEPLTLVRNVLVVPAGRAFYFNPRNLDIEPVVSASKDGKTITYIWERRDVPRLEREPDMPPLEEVVPSVEVSTFQDWNAFARWYWNLIRKQFEVSDELEAKARELTKDARTREEKVRAIYNFVVTDIRYNDKWEFGVHGFKPYNAAAIFSRRFGDCKDKATLMSTMLGVVGIRAYPVLIDGQDRRGREDLRLPLMNHFNHCIAYVPPAEADGPGWFLDGTAEHHEATNLPAMDQGATVLVVTEEGGEIQRIPWPEPFDHGIRERYRIAVLPGGDAVVAAEVEPTGRFASAIRELFSQAGERKETLERVYGRELAGATVVEEDFGDLKDLDRPVKVKFTLKVPKVVKKGSTGFRLEEVRSVLFRWIYAAKATDLAPKAERKEDVVLPVPAGVEETIEYGLPEGYTVEELPEKAAVESEFGRFEKSYELEGRTLRVRRRFEMKAQRVPVEKYAEFRRFAIEVDRADDAKVILGKGGAEE